jgi:two-component system sensor histidine kinase VicK
VNKVVNYIVEELRKSAPKRTILFETTSNVVLVNTDEVKLLQIVNNFASNAVKFTHENSEIRISVREGKDAVVIAVSDNGIGIPAALQPFVFEKHGPARRTGLNGERSIGLGLSICRNLVNLIGGKIWFESKEGTGTTFFVELPKE